MDIIYTSQNEETTVKLSGEVDHHGAKSARETIDGIIREESPQTLIMDMSSVTFCDSSGLGLIMGRYKKMNELGGSLLIKRPTEAVEKIIRISGLDRLIKIVD